MDTKNSLFSYNIWLQFYIERFVDDVKGFSRRFDLQDRITCVFEQPAGSDKTLVRLLLSLDVHDVESHRSLGNELNAPELKLTFQLFQLAYAFVSGNILTSNGEYHVLKIRSEISQLPKYANDFNEQAEKAHVKIPNWLCAERSIHISFSGKMSEQTISETMRCLGVLLEEQGGEKRRVLEDYRKGLLSAFNPYNYWRCVRETIESTGCVPKDENVGFLKTVDNTFSHSPDHRRKYEKGWSVFKSKYGELATNAEKRQLHYVDILKKMISKYLYG